MRLTFIRSGSWESTVVCRVRGTESQTATGAQKRYSSLTPLNTRTSSANESSSLFTISITLDSAHMRVIQLTRQTALVSVCPRNTPVNTGTRRDSRHAPRTQQQHQLVAIVSDWFVVCRSPMIHTHTPSAQPTHGRSMLLRCHSHCRFACCLDAPRMQSESLRAPQ